MNEKDSAISIARLVERALYGLLTVLMAVIGVFLYQALETLNKTHEAQANFQTQAIEKLAAIAGDVKATVTQLTAHERQDELLRAADSEAARERDRRLLTLERQHPTTNGMLAPTPYPWEIKPK